MVPASKCSAKENEMVQWEEGKGSGKPLQQCQLTPFHVLAVYGSVARRVWLLLVLLLMASKHLVEEVKLRGDRASHG